MSAGLHEARSIAGAQVHLLGCPGSLTAGANHHDRIRIFFDPNTRDCANTGVSTAIRNRRKSVLPHLPRINIPTRCGEVSLLEVPERIRAGMVAPKLQGALYGDDIIQYR